MSLGPVVTFAGVPLAGKTTLIRHLKDSGTELEGGYSVDDTDRFIRARRGMALLQTAPGAVFYRERAYEFVLRDASAIVYVFQNLMPWGGFDVADYLPFEQDVFRSYHRLATSMGKGWDHVPWLFVRAKIEFPCENPGLHLVPVTHHRDILQTSAATGVGINRLGEWIDRLIHQGPGASKG